MLLLGSKSMTIEGITVFPDHADPSQFWYLPSPVNLARKGIDNRAVFTLIEYRPAAVAGGAKGGGFLSFEVNLHLDPALEGKILSKVSSMSKGVPKLAVVPFDEGKVQCIALNLQGPGGTTANPAEPGTFNAVETILGASVPSLFGDDSAAFSMTLSQEGAIIARKAFEEGTTPIGVIYELKFTGIRPALDVKITADLQRIYTQFSASLSGQYYFIQAGIEAGFEKLVQEGAIKIEVTNFTTEGDRKEKEKWALDFFKDKLLSEWFTPSLAPGQLAGGAASSGEPKPKEPPEKPPEKPPVKPSEPSPPTVPEGKPAIALKIKFIRQEEQKTITLEYHSSEAVQRTYAPQGFFGLLLADLEDKENHFVSVDLDAPFFRVFTVTIDAPIDFQKIGLNSVHVAIDYGNPSDMTSYKHGDFIFDAADHGEKKFEVFMNPEHDTFYTYLVQYNFDPGSGWEGKDYSYELPPKRTEDRTLNLNPFEDIGFLDVKVFPNRIDKGIVDSTDVHLQYQDQSGWIQERTINVTPGLEPQFWKLRLNDPKAKDYTYWFVHNMKDGSTKQTEHVITSARAVSLDDPFEGKIEIELIPLYDPSSVRMVYVDIVYSDPENQYEREERVKFMGNASDSVKVLISLMDPSKRTFKYRFTFIGSDNNMRRGPFIETVETLIGVSE